LSDADEQGIKVEADFCQPVFKPFAFFAVRNPLYRANRLEAAEASSEKLWGHPRVGLKVVEAPRPEEQLPYY
jgi:hypothetical protein